MLNWLSLSDDYIRVWYSGQTCVSISCHIYNFVCFQLILLMHNIIQVHNNVLWDWQYYTEYSPHSHRMWEHSAKYCQSHGTLLCIWIMSCAFAWTFILYQHWNYCKNQGHKIAHMWHFLISIFPILLGSCNHAKLLDYHGCLLVKGDKELVLLKFLTPPNHKCNVKDLDRCAPTSPNKQVLNTLPNR